MGDFNNPNENNNVQENNLNNGQPNNLNAGQPDNLNNDQQQNQQPQYDQNQNQQGNPYQQPQYNQPQYQQPQYGGQSGYQQNNQQNQLNNGQYQQNNGQYQQNPYQQNPYQQYSQYPQPQKKDNAMAIAALICGIVGVVLGCCAWYITLPVSIVGLVLGILCINKKKDGRTMAIIGIILCVFGILIGILAIIGMIAIMSGGESYLNDFYSDFNWEEYY